MLILPKGDVLIWKSHLKRGDGGTCVYPITAQLLVPFRYDSPVWPVKNAEGIWSLMEDNCQLNSVFAPAVRALPDIVTITESVAHDGTQDAILDFGHAFSPSLWHAKIQILHLA